MEESLEEILLGKNTVIFVLQHLGFAIWAKQGKVLPRAEEGDGVPRFHHKLRIDDYLFTLRES